MNSKGILLLFVSPIEREWNKVKTGIMSCDHIGSHTSFQRNIIVRWLQKISEWVCLSELLSLGLFERIIIVLIIAFKIIII